MHSRWRCSIASAAASGRTVERGGGLAQVVDRRAAGLQRKATQPPHRGALVTLGVSAAQDQADAQCVVEGDLRQLARSREHDGLVAGVQRAAEARVGVALAGHVCIGTVIERMFAYVPAGMRMQRYEV